MNQNNSNQVANMIDLSQGGMHFYVSENPLEEIKSNANLNPRKLFLRD